MTAHEVERLTDADILRRQAEADAVRARYPAIDWAQLLAAPAPPPDWLLEPVLEAGAGHALSGPPKSGKSLLALEMAAAIAAANPVFGNRARPARDVVYLDAENTLGDLRERLQAFGYDDPRELRRLHYLSFVDVPPLDKPAGGAALAAIADVYGARLVVLDTIGRYVAGEENSADTWHAVYRHALAPLKAAGVAVLRLDHAGKDATRGARGSSAKDGDVDHVWQLTDNGAGRITLQRTRSRNGHGADWLHLHRRFEPLRHDADFARTPDSPDPLDDDVAVLDELQLPLGAGRRLAAQSLRARGHAWGHERVDRALKARRDRTVAVSNRPGVPE